MSGIEDLKAAIGALADECDREIAILLASRERLTERHIEAAGLFEGSADDETADALVKVSQVYTELENQVGELNLCVQVFRDYVSRV